MLECHSLSEQTMYRNGLYLQHVPLGEGGTQTPLPLLYQYLTDTIRREGQPTMGSAQGSPDSLGEGLDEV